MMGIEGVSIAVFFFLEVAERWFCVMGWNLVKIRVPWNSTRWLRWLSYEGVDGSRKVR